MEENMIRCPDCGRHHMAEESACPFCKKSRPLLNKAAKSATVLLSAMVLMACYGGFKDTAETGTPGDTTIEDVDSDGFTVDDGDCNDDNADINPVAEEICNDKIDNDCDDLTDMEDDDCSKGG